MQAASSTASHIKCTRELAQAQRRGLRSLGQPDTRIKGTEVPAGAPTAEPRGAEVPQGQQACILGKCGVTPKGLSLIPAQYLELFAFVRILHVLLSVHNELCEGPEFPHLRRK